MTPPAEALPCGCRCELRERARPTVVVRDTPRPGASHNLEAWRAYGVKPCARHDPVTYTVSYVAARKQPRLLASGQVTSIASFVKAISSVLTSQAFSENAVR